mmetsp:Transcript_27731/g.59271  ORF Transcript_27731/g.59271 Transcript_27731/m.59271 type:complete len:122 (+) Transcript_27731:173-538(+)|eukprot:CAMPEP_0201163008 /NCGR_PEP_ID=MMETSP0851-20130426/54014_1 /ASSEMBLY_ACC=CAM_ASM_000631 /TAXON_ID=183588 /ORGANISM="Pseudo-nitzschia fraudulenta, Strain WWA7" /LENGTH=121 /DNA_ID=CAMNT_0047442979 /DNA_START=241 /DNA_END=606 /DNA_ORIENTATION=+
MDRRRRTIPTIPKRSPKFSLMTPSPDGSFDGEYQSFTPPPPKKTSDPSRSVTSSQLPPLSCKLAIPALVLPDNPPFEKGNSCQGTTKTVEREDAHDPLLHVPSLKLAPKRSGKRRQHNLKF